VIIVGRKSGKGIFVYTPNAKSRDENVGATDILKRYKTDSPITYVVFYVSVLTLFVLFLEQCWR